MKTAVIGASGFLGKYIVLELLKNSHEVTGVYHKNIADHTGCKQINITEFLKNDYEFDNIVFAAGSYLNTHQQLIELNCDLVSTVTKMYSDARFLYVSSVNVYGIHNDIITENSSFNSPSLYGRSKLASEFIVSSCKSYAIIRFTYLYGPHLNNNSFLPTIIGQALSKKTIGLMGEGKRSQDYLYVTDAARLCVEALHSTLNDVYLGASGKSYSNFEIGKIICDNVPGCEITFSGTENGVSFHINPAHAMKTLNWVPEVDINAGIKQCLI